MRLSIFFSCLAGLAGIAGLSVAQQPTPPAVIESPRLGATVQAKDRVIIRMLRAGRPMVAIRSLQPGSKWWIQETGEPKSPGRFEIPVRFGNDQTRLGTKFQIAALITTDSATTMFDPGTALDQLPEEFQRIAVDEVVRGQADLAERSPGQQVSLAAELISPAPNSRAKRIQLVSLKLTESTDRLPRLVVRSAEEKSQWWVQEPLQHSADGELLTGVARLGNEKTVAGSKFLLMLIQPTDEQSRASLKTGLVLTDLTGFKCSQVIPLIAGSEADDPAPAAEANALSLN
jgi:hypothetical protein